MLSQTVIAAFLLVLTVLAPPVAALGVVTFVTGAAKQVFYAKLAAVILISVHIGVAVWTYGVFPQVWDKGLGLTYFLVLGGYGVAGVGILAVAEQTNSGVMYYPAKLRRIS